MKKLGFLMLIPAITLMLGGTALAQAPAIPYFTTYYSNANTANAPDATVRIINDGSTGDDLYANIYVFDDSEELLECCSCVVTPDGLLSESVNNNLTASPITGIKPTCGVIKVTSSDVSGKLGKLAARLTATHVQKTSPVKAKTIQFDLTESPFADSNLATSEQLLLQQLCYFDGLLSGKPCTCTPEDQDF
jgi:hypothetical protein